MSFKSGRPCRIALRGDTYKNWKENNPILLDREIIVVQKCPWYISFFGLKPTRLKIGDGVTPFSKLRFL